jgi:hypothetical protein
MTLVLKHFTIVKSNLEMFHVEVCQSTSSLMDPKELEQLLREYIGENFEYLPVGDLKVPTCLVSHITRIQVCPGKCSHPRHKRKRI